MSYPSQGSININIFVYTKIGLIETGINYKG